MKPINGVNGFLWKRIGVVKPGIRLLLLLPLLAGQLPAQPVITNQPANQTVVLGGNATFGVMATGVGPFTYQWQFNSTNLPNQNNTIMKVAGKSGQVGFGGDGGLATNAILFHPSGVTIDASGNIFIADQYNNRIRKVSVNGTINNVAGIGPSATSGTFSGDGGAATNAGLNLIATYPLSVSSDLTIPAGVAVDAWGNYYIADASNNRIRKVDTNGIITTIAGTNSAGFSGDGGLAISAELNTPSGVALDNFGNLFLADTDNNRIRKVDTNGIITTVAGNGSAGYSGDGGAATNASFNLPFGVAVDNFGNVFIADGRNNIIRKVDVNGIITTLAGNGIASYSGDGGAATNASLNQPYGVAVDAYDDVFIADHSNDRIRMVGATGTITTVAGSGNPGYSGDGGSASNASLSGPLGVGLDTNGNLFIAGETIRKVIFGRIPTLQLSNVSATNAGNYTVIITSPYGSATSSNATLTVLLPPTITSQPANITVTDGASANFNVIVSGTAPLSYQWWMSSGRGATAAPVFFGGSLFGAVVTSGGAGYSSVPQVHFVGGSIIAASGTAVVSNCMVTAINMISHGVGYTTAPAIQIDAPSVTNAFLPDQTNATLTLPAVTSANATNYFVLVTNNYGSVTSATVALTVFLPPQNFTAQNLVNGLQMQLTGTPNYPYILQSATNLTPPVNWQPILTNPADVNGNWSFTITNLSRVPDGFYRAVGQ